MLGSDVLRPGLDWATINFHCFATVGAYQVVVVIVHHAAAVKSFTSFIVQRIDGADLRHLLQGAVNGGQAHLFALLREFVMNILGTGKSGDPL